MGVLDVVLLMSTSIEEIKDMYRDCERCGHHLCTEDGSSVQDSYRDWFCGQECLDAWNEENEDHHATQHHLDRWAG